MADPKPVQLLTLDSLIDRPVVVIKGREYLLITNAMLPPLDAHKVQRYANRIDALMKQDEVSEAEEQELATLPDKMCRLILDAPDAVQLTLTDRQRMEIIGAFVTAPLQMAGRLGRPTMTSPSPMDPLTGVSSLPDSLTDTAAIPSRG